MYSIKLIVKSKKFNCEIKLNRRITIIKGDSGVGKTMLSDLLTDAGEDVEVECKLNIAVLIQGTWENSMRTMSDMLFVIDDKIFAESPGFADALSKSVSNGNYFIIISRVVLHPDSLKRISYSSNEIYDFKCNGVNHWIEKRYTYSYDEHTFNDDVSCFLIEDNKAGYEFFSKLVTVDCIPSTGGKSTIIDDLEELGKHYKSIFVVVDTASFGCHMEEFYSNCNWYYGFNVVFMPDYECFEELLIRTNMVQSIGVVKKELSMISKYANREISWEVYFEKLLERVTKDKIYKQSHSRKLNICYYEDCNSCNSIKSEKCGMSNLLSGDKFTALLKDTKYERLLDYH